MTSGAQRRGGVALFLAKFAVFAPIALGLWWEVQPYYVEFAGQAAGFLIRYVAGFSVTGMQVTVDPAGVLKSKTLLSYIYEGRSIEIKVAFLVANLPTYLALILATPGLAWRKRGRALAFGSAILFAGHVVFLSVMFIFSREVRNAPELPTAFGLFVMTLPFLLWIVFAYWEGTSAWIGEITTKTLDDKPASKE